MKVHDISRELTTAPVFPGDPPVSVSKLTDIQLGDVASTSCISACLHSGTHMDAPCHFYPEATDIESIPIDQVVGECYVVEATGVLVGEDIERIIPKTQKLPRILFKGDATLSQSAAFALLDVQMQVIGVEGTSVAPMSETAVVHRKLLSSGCVLLEGLDLSNVSEGRYLLIAAPIKIKGADGSPVRAILLEHT